MTKISRKDIQVISRHSNWSESGVDHVLKKHIYHGPRDWKRFLSLFFLGLGVSFTLAGIIFFFAYNWDNLHKFVKIGLVEGLVLALMLTVLFSKLDQLIKNILVTASAVLVGVLMAIFGQVYQTGANAYDLFLGWTLLITLWVIVSNFAPLWLLYIVLANISIILYDEQVANDWPNGVMHTILFTINSAFALFFILCHRFTDKIKPPNWFTSILVIASVSIGTIGVGRGIEDSFHPSYGVLFIIVFALYTSGFRYGIQNKQILYLSLIPFSVILIVSKLLMKILDGATMYLTVSLFIVFSVSLLIKTLINLQKKWRN
ncbi:DUF2157 domain-containing protein [Flagellimonas onchidii]|uniref:DUF2157 domain-containing protein n=1 Tax=Flagellimonas onchidii TaxID=2562684 RepID=UPI0010A5CF8E|nr:DUF2157 domain-containing protein [Allomuricauda onchidii]